jgi:NADPH2:quinone reductase
MKAAVCRQFGGPDVIAVEDWPKPAPAVGEVLVRVHAAGVNHADLVVLAGQYQLKQEPPFIPGMEVAGEIVELGPTVVERSRGERVVALTDGGGYAEYVAVAATRAFPVPETLSLPIAAGTFINYATAFGALRWRAQLQRGETCLVLGGAGGLGLASIVLAKSMGARVIGAASSPERCKLMAEHGADETIDYVASPRCPCRWRPGS